MLPKTLATKDRFGSYIYDGTGLLVAVVDVGDDIEIIAELVHRWNAFEAMGEAIGLILKSKEAYESGDDIGSMMSYGEGMAKAKAAYALYLRPENNPDLRGQNVDETA